MNRDIRQSRINEDDKIKNVNDAWDHIKNILLEVFQKHVPIINKGVRKVKNEYPRQATQENEKNSITI